MASPSFRATFAAFCVAALGGCGGSRPPAAAGNNPAHPPKKERNYFDNFASVTEEVVRKLPPWDPTQPPPRSVEELAAIAIAAYTPLPTQPKTGWRLNSITYFQVPEGMWPNLRSHDRELFKNKWYCQVTIDAWGDLQGDWYWNSAVINLFLDGTLIGVVPPSE